MTSKSELRDIAFNLECTEERLNQLGALFSAIVSRCEDKKTMPNALLNHIKSLAGLGWASSDEWADNLSIIRDNLGSLEQKEAA